MGPSQRLLRRPLRDRMQPRLRDHRKDYYRRLYRETGAFTVVTAEHTGALTRALTAGNKAIARHVEAHPETDGMGCTATAMLFAGRRMGLIHVGDSRAYLLRDGILRQLTEDHTVAAEYVAQYEAQFGAGTASTFGGHAWDAVKAVELALLHAMEQGELDWDDTASVRQALRDALEDMGPFVGVGGVFDFTAEDHLGLDERALVIVEIRGGDWTLAD